MCELPDGSIALQLMLELPRAQGSTLSLVGDPEPGHRLSCAQILTHSNREIITKCSSQLLRFGVICYTAMGS